MFFFRRWVSAEKSSSLNIDRTRDWRIDEVDRSRQHWHGPSHISRDVPSDYCTHQRFFLPPSNQNPRTKRLFSHIHKSRHKVSDERESTYLDEGVLWKVDGNDNVIEYYQKSSWQHTWIFLFLPHSKEKYKWEQFYGIRMVGPFFLWLFFHYQRLGSFIPATCFASLAEEKRERGACTAMK